MLRSLHARSLGGGVCQKEGERRSASGAVADIDESCSKFSRSRRRARVWQSQVACRVPTPTSSVSLIISSALKVGLWSAPPGLLCVAAASGLEPHRLQRWDERSWMGSWQRRGPLRVAMGLSARRLAGGSRPVLRASTSALNPVTCARAQPQPWMHAPIAPAATHAQASALSLCTLVAIRL